MAESMAGSRSGSISEEASSSGSGVFVERFVVAGGRFSVIFVEDILGCVVRAEEHKERRGVSRGEGAVAVGSRRLPNVDELAPKGNDFIVGEENRDDGRLWESAQWERGGGC